METPVPIPATGGPPLVELMIEPAVQTLADQFRVVTNAYLKTLDGIDRDALLTRPGARSNSLLWVAGHLVQSRARLINVLGGTRDLPWPELFRTGSTVVDPGSYPDAAAIIEQWRDLTEELMRRLEALGPADLSKDAPPRVASPDGSVRGAIALFAFHEGYHVGQLGFLRKWLGYGSLFD
jgi:uncharacterized damage-inducible protein DinB